MYIFTNDTKIDLKKILEEGYYPRHLLMGARICTYIKRYEFELREMLASIGKYRRKTYLKHAKAKILL